MGMGVGGLHNGCSLKQGSQNRCRQIHIRDRLHIFIARKLRNQKLGGLNFWHCLNNIEMTKERSKMLDGMEYGSESGKTEWHTGASKFGSLENTFSHWATRKIFPDNMDTFYTFLSMNYHAFFMGTWQAIYGLVLFTVLLRHPKVVEPLYHLQ